MGVQRMTRASVDSEIVKNGHSTAESPPSVPQSTTDKTDKTQAELFLEKCTLHGIQEVFTAKTVCYKIFWAVSFTAALIAAGYGCIAIILEYLASPVVISYFVNESENISLPDVVVCPFNRFNSKFLKDNNISYDLSDFMELAFGFGTPYKFSADYKAKYYTDDSNLAVKSQELNELLQRLQMNFTEFINAASLSCDQIINSCIFEHRTFDCCNSSIPYMTGLGRCYRLLGKTQTAAGYGFGMTIVVNLSTSLFTPSHNTLHNDGIIVILAESGRGADFDMTFVPSAAHAIMPLRATSFEFINDPPRYECESDKDNKYYSRVHCFQDCIFYEGQSRCNCSHAASMYPTKVACTTEQFKNCLMPETSRSLTENPNLVNICRKRCKPTCKYWQYTTSLSYARFPSETLRELLKSDEEFEGYKRLIILNVFFEKLEFTLIKHFARMTADQFIANIGGQIGLWVGGSVLTILQISVFLFQSLRRLATRPIRRFSQDSADILEQRRYEPPMNYDQYCQYVCTQCQHVANCNGVARNVTLDSMLESNL